MTGPLLTARQVAELLGVHVKTVLAWVQRGELPAIRLPGGAIRFRESDLDAWLEHRATGADTVDRTEAAGRRWSVPGPTRT